MDKQNENFIEKNVALTEFLMEEYLVMFDIDLDNDSFEYLVGSEQDFDFLKNTPKIYSISSQNFINRMVLPEARAEVMAVSSIENLKDTLRNRERVELEFQAAVGSQKWYGLVYQGRNHDENGIPHRAVMGIHKIDMQHSQRIREQSAVAEAYNMAEEAAKAKTNFLARMSHDIRTPMNAIIGMNAIASSHLDDRDRVANCLRKIDLASKHLLTLVNDILDFNRIESGREAVELEPLNLRDFGHELVDIIMTKAEEKDQKFSLEASGIEDGDILADSGIMKRIINGIVGNAIKYTPAGGNIKVTFLQDKIPDSKFSNYIFICEDDGIGMSEEYLKQVFEPFTRSDDARIKNIQGTGLGMAITQNLVKLLGGTIKIDSKQNEGTKVTISAPFEVLDGEDIKSDELKGHEVLVLTGDERTAKKVREMLQSFGMIPQVFDKADEAAESAAQRRAEGRDYHAILLDCVQNGMSHIDAAKIIRRKVGFELPIILAESISAVDNELESKALGITKSIAKPIFKTALAETLRTVSHHHKENVPIPDGGESDATAFFEEEMDFSGKQILLVEDNELNAEIAKEIFGLTHATITWVENGQEAVNAVRDSEENFFDIIFMDIQMPVMNGYEATLAIRELPRRDVVRMPIIALTANAFSSDVQQARNAGMNEHLTKPIEFPRLEEVMKKYLGN